MEVVEDEVEAIEAEFELEGPAKCPSCREKMQKLNVVRSLRTRVNFTSNLPRRGFAILCPNCDVILAANIGSRML